MICSKCGTKSTGANQKCFICGGDLIPEENEDNNSVQQPSFNNSFIQPNVVNNQPLENNNTINQSSVSVDNSVNLFNSGVQQPNFNNSFIEPNVMNNQPLENNNTINQSPVSVDNSVNLFNSGVQQPQINQQPVQDNNLNTINNQVPQSQPMFNQTNVNNNLNSSINSNPNSTPNNKKNNKMIIVLLAVLVIGALVFGISKVIGKNSSGAGESGSKSDDYFVYYEDAKLLKNIESVKLQEGISYKKLDYYYTDSFTNKTEVLVLLVVYNDTDDVYDIENIAYAAPISPHSAITVHMQKEDFEKKGIRLRKAKYNSISKNDYTFDKYVLDKENGYLYAYFTFNGNGENNTELIMYGVKDGKVTHKFSSFSSKCDENGEWIRGDVTNKGEKALFWLGNPNQIKFDEFDYFFYTIGGYYED